MLLSVVFISNNVCRGSRIYLCGCVIDLASKKDSRGVDAFCICVVSIRVNYIQVKVCLGCSMYPPPSYLVALL